MIKDIHTIVTALGNVAYHSTLLAIEVGKGISGGLDWLFSSAPEPDNQTPLEAWLENGRPVVRWLADTGEYGESWWGTVYENVTTNQMTATIDDEGRFIVTRQALRGVCIWRHSTPSNEPEETESFEVDHAITVLCDLPYAQLKGFTIEPMSAELSSSSLEKYRSGRLHFTEHQLIRASFVSGETGILSYCQRGQSHTKDVVYALMRYFIADKHKLAPPPPPRSGRRSDPI